MDREEYVRSLAASSFRGITRSHPSLDLIAAEFVDVPNEKNQKRRITKFLEDFGDSQDYVVRSALARLCSDLREPKRAGLIQVRSESCTEVLPALGSRKRSHRSKHRSRKGLWKRVFERDGYRCVYCGKSGNTIDHVIPRSKGGTNVLHNLVASCESCNGDKSDQLWSPEKLNEQMKFTTAAIRDAVVAHMRSYMTPGVPEER